MNHLIYLLEFTGIADADITSLYYSLPTTREGDKTQFAENFINVSRLCSLAIGPATTITSHRERHSCESGKKHTPLLCKRARFGIDAPLYSRWHGDMA